MFRRPNQPIPAAPAPVERVTSVLGPGVNWKGDLHGSGGIRIEGMFEGDIAIKGLLVVGETGKVTCENLRANTVIVAGIVNGNITSEKLDIRATGRVWGDVITQAFTTEEGSFLRGQVRMEDHVELNLETPRSAPEPVVPEIEPMPVPQPAPQVQVPATPAPKKPARKPQPKAKKA
ncbi:MAG TPA: polymer-forming cytoskeletal protein [Longilinea sp.]|nr:polymer-forming cytoskeletal protein [Longilinea sp.]